MTEIITIRPLVTIRAPAQHCYHTVRILPSLCTQVCNKHQQYRNLRQLCPHKRTLLGRIVTWWLLGVLCHQKHQVSRKENCPRKKLNAASFLVHILSSEQVTGKQDHVDICCLALCKHTLKDDLYVSWNFLLLNLCDDCLHWPLLYVNSQVSILWMDLKMENIWEFFWNLSEL